MAIAAKTPTPEAFAQIVAEHLDPADVMRIGTVFMKYPRRAALLFSAYGGEEMTGLEFARLALRIAKRIEAEGGGAPT